MANRCTRRGALPCGRSGEVVPGDGSFCAGLSLLLHCSEVPDSGEQLTRGLFVEARLRSPPGKRRERSGGLGGEQTERGGARRNPVPLNALATEAVYPAQQERVGSGATR